ncbi:MAG: cation-transporting P-type ATPase, partial [Deltaproteobacteria bacterium]|nr:cation-transporting P-type ATPase [Deltaproteobacteria bacterium]
MTHSASHRSCPLHTVAIADVYTRLDSQPQGLTTTEAVARLQRCGANTIHALQTRSLIRKLLSNFTHLMAMLLWVGGVLGFLAGMAELGIAIWVVNLINGFFSFWQEYQAEKATDALRRLLPLYARVRRDGLEERVRAEDLVPGDVILLAEGDHISADARLVHEADLRVDQSTLTGESHPVRKTADLVFAGTSVAAGTGVAVVFATAMQREVGKIAHLTQSVIDTHSPLQQEMQRATKIVTVIAVAVGCLFFLLAVTFTGITVLEGFIFALGMIVAFVPEGMVPTVTLALAMGTQRMARRHALVKRLSAVETLGCTTVICTDKTGTLTQNEMTVSELWVAGRSLTVTGVGYAPEGHLLDQSRPLPTPVTSEVRELLVAASLCNDARVLPPNSVSSQWTILGDPTEAALLVVAAKAGVNGEQETRQWPRFREIPFDSRRKRMTTIHWG